MTLQNNNTKNPHPDWDHERQNLINEIHDLKVLYETVAEHSSTIENELEQKNQEITSLIQQLRKYLSPQLYNLIVGKPEDAPLKYQRKFLTIFFSDIVGFTEISNRADPEILSSLLNAYLNDMAQIAIRYGGTIDKFIGDAIMIFFGDPEYSDDQTHARDCGRMALDMREKIAKIDREWIQKGIPQGLKVRMGIHSGYCTVGNFGSENRMDYTIIGGNVNIASRLESLAGPNSILSSAVTRNLLSEEFVSHFYHSIQIKGIHHPVDVYEVLGYQNSENAATNPYFSLNQNGFSLDKIHFDASSADREQLQLVEEALRNALTHIKKSQ